GNAFMYTMNWNPTYSYSSLPKGYVYDSLPAHWNVMLQKVEPEEKGIPKFRNIYVSNVKVDQARKAINASGLKESTLDNFNFSNIKINAVAAGDINFARGWKLTNVTIKATDNNPIAIKNSEGVRL
ncbi:MAG TPA: hypothetical protein VM935_19695, partial [Chitinophagaceae bacterium]|nr:hypothetical protein [Chitinophagaceae bacterium]